MSIAVFAFGLSSTTTLINVDKAPNCWFISVLPPAVTYKHRTKSCFCLSELSSWLLETNVTEINVTISFVIQPLFDCFRIACAWEQVNGTLIQHSRTSKTQLLLFICCFQWLSTFVTVVVLPYACVSRLDRRSLICFRVPIRSSWSLWMADKQSKARLRLHQED